MLKISYFFIFIFLGSGQNLLAQYFERIYTGLNLQAIGTVDNTIDGGFVFCGGRNDGFLMKLNSMGDSLWASADTNNLSQGAAVIQEASGNFLVCGSGSSQLYSSVTVVARYDSAGNFLSDLVIPPVDGWGTWGLGMARSDDRLSSHYYYYSDGWTASNFVLLDNGDVIAGDNTRVTVSSVSVNNNGDYLSSANLAFDMDSLFNWRNNVLILAGSGFPRSQHFFDTDISSNAMTPDGGFAVAGLYDSSGTKMVRIMRFDSGRNMLWERLIPDAAINSLDDIEMTPDGGFALLCGRNDGSSHIAIIKTDSTGNMQWTEKYHGTGNAIPRNFRILQDGFVMLGSSNGHPYLVRTDGFGKTNTTGYSELNSIGKGVIVYPNPSEGIINITLTGISCKEVSLSVFDLVGRKVFSSKVLHPVQDLNLSFLARGVYQFQITVPGGQLKNGKFVIE